uniref:hypothetical protein n=1 Tax=Piscicoccus intestinalis TaxID=746033 RepID=UPI0035712AF8
GSPSGSGSPSGTAGTRGAAAADGTAAAPEETTPGPRGGLASDPEGLFDLPEPRAPRPRPHVDRDGYDPDSLDDVVQTGDE